MSELPERIAKLEVAVEGLTVAINELKTDLKSNNKRFITKMQVFCWVAGFGACLTGIAKGWLKI